MTEHVPRPRQPDTDLAIGAVRAAPLVDAGTIAARVDALGRFVRVSEPYLEAERLRHARAVVGRAGQRLALPRDHTVVALAGATGSGKSSLFNALADQELSPVGVRRPTTGEAYACVWGTRAGASEMLDWLQIPPAHRFAREDVLDGGYHASVHASLRGLVLVDLPDLDSVEGEHRGEVERLLGLVDMVVWVLDPQKYADLVIHDRHLRPSHRHRDVTLVALNQADLLAAADLDRLLVDLRRLLAADGLAVAPAMATSAVDLPSGVGQLRATLERAVADRRAPLRRIAADLGEVVEELDHLIRPGAGSGGRVAGAGVAGRAGASAGVAVAIGEQPVVAGRAVEQPRAVEQRIDVRELTDMLAEVAGVPAITEAVAATYRRRAEAATASPPVRWVRRPGEPELSEPAVQRAVASLAVRTVAARAADGLPPPWPDAVVEAARSSLDGLPDALGAAVASTDLGADRTPRWWRMSGALQWLALVVALAGLGWLVAGWVLRAVGLPAMHPMVATVPVPALLLLVGLLALALSAVLMRPLVRWAARRARDRASGRLRAAVAAVGREQVVMPVHAVLHAFAEASEALHLAGGHGAGSPPRHSYPTQSRLS